MKTCLEQKLTYPIFTLNSLPNWGMVTASKYHSKNNKNYSKTNKQKKGFTGSKWQSQRKKIKYRVF